MPRPCSAVTRWDQTLPLVAPDLPEHPTKAPCQDLARAIISSPRTALIPATQPPRSQPFSTSPTRPPSPTSLPPSRPRGPRLHPTLKTNDHSLMPLPTLMVWSPLITPTISLVRSSPLIDHYCPNPKLPLYKAFSLYYNSNQSEHGCKPGLALRIRWHFRLSRWALGWMRMIGAESVEYHRSTVLRRGDDYPGMALEYYASRGETPLVWGGSGRAVPGLEGAVSPGDYEAIFGPGGARDPRTGERLVSTRRPGMEVVISAHKSVAELGVIGRAEDMHRIMDAERDATLAYMDQVTRQMGGRRGRGGQGLADRWAHLCPHPPRHFTRRRPLPARPCIAGQPCRDEGRAGWVEGAGHGAVARAPARRHHGRTGGSSPGGGRTGLRHRSRPRPLGAARALEDRRHPRRSYGGPLEAGGRNRRRVPAPRRHLLPCPRVSPPAPPARPSATNRRAT